MRTLLEVGLYNAVAAAALALAAAAVARFARRPALAHALWLLVLLKLVTPPLFPVFVPWPDADSEPAPPTTAAEAGVTTAEAGVAGDVLADPPDEPDPAMVLEALAVPELGDAMPAEASPRPASVAWDGYVAAVWLSGAALWFLWAGLHVRRFGCLLRLARPAPAALQAEADALARRLGLRRPLVVWLVPGAVSPMVWALGRAPRLLFPSALLGQLDDEGRASLLAHELAHVQRRDHWVRLLEILVSGLYWWHPAVWWARHELREAEEQCCDAWAVWALGGRGRPYALALVHAAAFVSQTRPPLPVGASGVGQVRSLKRRLTMILRARTARSLSWPGRVAVLGLGLLLLPLFAVRAQDRPAPVRDTRDQQIEALKQAIRVLEEQKRAEGQRAAEPSVAPLPPVPASPRAASFPGLMPSAAQAAPPRRETSGAPPMREAADEQLEATARDLEKTIAAKRKELDVLEGKYRDVRAKLGERDPNWRRLQPTPFPPAGVPHRGVPYGPQFPPAGTPVPSTQRPEPTPAPSGGGGAGAQNRDRVRDVEMQLEKVLREVEALRREIQRGQSSGRPETGSPDRFRPPAPNTPYPAKP